MRRLDQRVPADGQLREVSCRHQVPIGEGELGGRHHELDVALPVVRAGLERPLGVRLVLEELAAHPADRLLQLLPVGLPGSRELGHLVEGVHVHPRLVRVEAVTGVLGDDERLLRRGGRVQPSRSSET